MVKTRGSSRRNTGRDTLDHSKERSCRIIIWWSSPLIHKRQRGKDKWGLLDMMKWTPVRSHLKLALAASSETWDPTSIHTGHVLCNRLIYLIFDQMYTAFVWLRVSWFHSQGVWIAEFTRLTEKAISQDVLLFVLNIQHIGINWQGCLPGYYGQFFMHSGQTYGTCLLGFF